MTPRRATAADAVALAAAAALFGYAVARAVRVPITYDEAAAWVKYIDAGWRESFSFAYATNHLLNTLLVRAAVLAGGTHEITLRLPSLAGFALFLASAWSLARRTGHPVAALAGFALLTANPYLLDFFALSRGYGLSIGLFMASLAALVPVLGGTSGIDGTRRSLAPVLACGVAAVAANFSILNAWLALWGVTAVVAFARARGVADYGETSPRSARAGSTAMWTWRALSALFAWLVLSHEPALSMPAERAAAVVALVAVFEAAAIALDAIATLAVHAGRLHGDDARALVAAVRWTMTVAGLPVLLLQWRGELYFGGDAGLVPDTFGSLVDGTFYTVVHTAAQVETALAIAGGLVLGLLVSLGVLAWRGRVRAAVPAIAVAAVAGIAVAAAWLQHGLLGTKYPLGRTALIFVPLASSFVVLAASALRGVNRAMGFAAMTLVGVLGAGATAHLVRTANLVVTFDWPEDAAAKTLPSDLAPAIAAARITGRPVVLEVYQQFGPAAAFYIRRRFGRLVEIVPEPSPRGSDFRYVREGEDPPAALVVARYPRARSVLVRGPGATPTASARP